MTEGQSNILTLTSQIVTAHLTHNALEAGHLPELIRTVYSTLQDISTPVVEKKVEPAVPVKKSVFEDHVVCLECGKSFRTLRRHLQIDHRTTIDDYRVKFDLPRDYPLVAPAYAKTRSEIAKKLGLGKNPPAKRAQKKK